MPAVTGNLTDVGGGHLAGKVPELIFTLNVPNAKAGVLYPTEPLKVTPAADGSWTAFLASTTDMHDDAWYTMRIQWVKSIEPRTYGAFDYPDWPIQVPPGGGSFSDLFGRPPKNAAVVYVSLEPPTSPGKWTFWLESDPVDPANPLNTGNLYQWKQV